MRIQLTNCSEQNCSVKLQLDRMESAALAFSSESASQAIALRENIKLDINRLLNNQTEQNAATDIEGRLEGIISSLKDLSLTMTTVPRENVILEHLFFSTMDARERNIDCAEEGTFKWIFDEEENPREEDHSSTGVGGEELRRRAKTRELFLDWLTSGRGVFHISGNPGSGKSTLMKFIRNHSRTQRELEKWADDKRKKLVVAHFYFWKSNNDKLQMSLEGLYRSILFKTLRQYPGLIPMLFPDHWERLKTDTLIFKEQFLQDSDLEQAFQLLTTTGTFPKHCFCFFVDGLDEYQGESRKFKQLARGIRKWASCDDVKFCASARPLAEFDTLAWPPNQEIRLHELTSHDIYLFTRKTIEKDENFKRIQDSYLLLVKKIVIKSEGVFMWAYLAVGSLLTILERHDSIEALETKLDTIPPKMNELYQELLGSMEPDDQERVVKMLLLTAHNPFTWELNCVAYWWIDNLSDPEFPPRDGIRPSSWPPAASLTNDARLRIKGLTKGLLHTTTMPNAFWIRNSYEDDVDPRVGELRIVQFFHRTVRDFVVQKLDSAQKPEVSCSLLDDDTYQRLLLAQLIAFDSWYQMVYWRRILYEYIVKREDLESPRISFERPLSIQALDGFKSHIDNVNSQPESGEPHYPFIGVFCSYNVTRWHKPLSFVHFATHTGQREWVMREVKRRPELLDDGADVNLLFSAALGLQVELLKDLIKHGCSPVGLILVAEQELQGYGNRGHTLIPVWMAIINALLAPFFFHPWKKLSEKSFHIMEVLLSDSRVNARNCVFKLARPTHQSTHFITLQQYIEESGPANMVTLLSLLQQRNRGTFMYNAKQLFSSFTLGRKPSPESLEAKTSGLQRYLLSSGESYMALNEICCDEYEATRVGVQWF
jgi:hypothetical protein